MADLIAREKPYTAWTENDVDYLMQNLSLIPSYIAKDFRIQGARFSIDATAHRQYAEVSNSCSISENLSLGVFHRLYQWYAESPKALLDPIAIRYDRGEPYLNEMMRRWNRRSSTAHRDRPWWHQISSITPVDSTQHYGVQA